MNELAENYWRTVRRNPTRILSKINYGFNPLNAELNTICHLLALLGTHHILHVSRIRVNKVRSKQCTLPFQCDVSVQEELL